MKTSFHDFVTVDMRGLKAALVARARAQRVSVSGLVRRAVARDLVLAAEDETRQPGAPPLAASSTATGMLSMIRMTADPHDH